MGRGRARRQARQPPRQDPPGEEPGRDPSEQERSGKDQESEVERGGHDLHPVKAVRRDRPAHVVRAPGTGQRREASGGIRGRRSPTSSGGARR